MPESLVQVTEGTGKKLHTWQRTIGANNVEDEVVVNGLPYLASYIAGSGLVSLATANSHVLQLMAGASLNVYVTRVTAYQTALATTAAIVRVHLLRLSTAGTGGGAVTSAVLDASDAASGATAMTLPTAKGTEGNTIVRRSCGVTQTMPTAGVPSTVVFEWDADRMKVKPIKISAGAANGIALKNIDAVAGASVDVQIEYFEASF